MLPRFHLNDLTTVGHYLGLIVLIAGASMAIPLIVALCFGEYSSAVDFVYGMGVSAVIGSVLRLLTPHHLDRRRSLLLCGLGWVVVAVVAAVPMQLSGDFDGFVDALFDAVSALTTTGVTVVNDIDSMSYAQSTWRAVLSLLGAQAIIIVALHLGFFGSGGYNVRENAAERHAATSSHNLRSTGRYVFFVAGITVVAGMVVVCVLCLVHGFNLGDAIMNGFWLSASAYSTGSFIPHTSSLIFYHSTWLNAFLSMLMLLGSLNFSIYAIAIRGNRKLMLNNTETRLYGLWITILVVVVSILQCRDGIFSSVSGLFDHGTFMVIAAATTSGMQTIYPQQLGITFASGPFILLMAAMLVGSSSNSTGGGIKIFRLQRLMHWFAYTIKRALVPKNVHVSIRYNHFGPRTMSPSNATLAMVITTLYIAGAVLGGTVFIAHGYEALYAMCESISYVTNSGFTTGITNAGMTVDLEIVAMLLMWMGRLEFVALIAMVTGLVASLIPRHNHVPEGVNKTRRDQRKAAAEKRRERRRSKLENKDGSISRCAIAVLLATCLALAFAPLALAAAGADDDQYPALEFSNKYRSVSISELVGASERLDGVQVDVAGVVTGQPTINPDGTAWVNIKKDGCMIGVLVTPEQLEQITYFGGYEEQGDTVVVDGKFNLSCADHSGELDIHADSLEITSVGNNWTHKVSGNRLLVGLVLIGLGLILIVVERVLHNKAGRRHAKMGRVFIKRSKR